MDDSVFHSESNGPVLQSNLGTIRSTHSQEDRSWNHGYLAFGKVLNVYPKRYTADVEIFKTADVHQSSYDLEGMHGCKIGVSTAGFSDLFQAPYGEIVPIQRGNIVLVGFLKNTKEQPVILRVFHDIGEDVGEFNFRNILPNYFSAYSNLGDILDYLKITPIQDFLKVDRFGNMELSSHTKSFFIATESQVSDDKFDYEDLSVKAPVDKTIINPSAGISDMYDADSKGVSYYNYGDDADTQLSTKTINVDEKYSKPKKYLAVFRDNYVDSATNWLKVIIDAANTTFRILKSQQQLNQSTVFDIDKDGTLGMRRQLDSRLLFDPDTPQTELNPQQNPSKAYSDIQLMPNGTIKIETLDRTTVNPNDPTIVNGFSSRNSVGADESKDFPHTRILINPLGGGIIIETNSVLSAYAKSGINMYSKNDININSEKAVNITSLQGTNVISQNDINISSQTTTYVGATGNVDVSAPDVGVSGAIDMRGSLDMKGKIELIGATNLTGKTRVNSRGPVLDGDHDSHGDRNYKSLSDRVKDMAIGFGMSYLSKQLAAPLSNMSSVLGSFHVATNGFGMDNINVIGTATRYASSTFGELIKPSSPFMPALQRYCIENSVAPSSMSTQIDFMNTYLELDLGDMGNLSTLGNLAKTMGFDLKRLKSIGDVASQLGMDLNFLTPMKQLADQYNADLNDLNIVNSGIQILGLNFKDVMTIVTQIKESGLNVNKVGELGVAAATEGEELNNLKDILKGGVVGVTNSINILWTRFMQTNDIHEDWGGAADPDVSKPAKENETSSEREKRQDEVAMLKKLFSAEHHFLNELPAEQQQHIYPALGLLKLELNPETLNTEIIVPPPEATSPDDWGLDDLIDSVDVSTIKHEGDRTTSTSSHTPVGGGGNTTETKIEYATAREALVAIAQYFVGGSSYVLSQVKQIEQYLDENAHLNVSQYADTNMKNTTTKPNNSNPGGGGNTTGTDSTTTVTPATATTLEQWLDHCIKRYVFIELF